MCNATLYTTTSVRAVAPTNTMTSTSTKTSAAAVAATTYSLNANRFRTLAFNIIEWSTSAVLPKRDVVDVRTSVVDYQGERVVQVEMNLAMNADVTARQVHI